MELEETRDNYEISNKDRIISITSKYPELTSIINKIHNLGYELDICDSYIDKLREENDMLSNENERLKFKLSLESVVLNPKKNLI